MSTEVDQRVVEMRFDNAQFEKNIKQSLKTLQELKKNTDMKDVVKGINEIEKSLNNFSLKNVSAAITSGIKEFGLLGVAGFTAFQRISNAAIDAAKQIANTVGELQAMKAGFREYETQINAVQTILANTSSKGTTIDDVNRALDELNEYADKTIYNFTQMTDNIGKFTAAGVGLEDSVAAIKGISNLAAISGSDAAQASRAMYNLSQALAMGKLQLMDWNSVVNAGMGGEIFQESLKETARVHGVMVDQIIEEEGSFRDSLSKGWITAEILTETLQKFTGDLSDEQLRSLGYTEEQIVAITELGQRANDAATQVKTFTQLFDTLNEARQSGWTQTWEIIIGDFYEARELLTEISNIFGGIINEQAEKRNSFLEAVLGPRGGGKDIKKQGEETVAALNASREEIQRVVDEIWNGAWGNGEERWAALAEAGYDPVLIQSLVDLTEATENNQIDWENLTEEQLRSVGASDEQIEAFRQLNGEMLQNVQNTEDLNAAEAEADNRVSGRQLLVDSLMNVLHGLMDIFGEIGKAWEEVFPPMSADTVYDMIVKFEELTEKFKLNDGQLNAIRIGFKGLFDVIGLVGDAFGSFWQIIKNVFGMLSGGEGEKGLTFLQKFAIFGSKLSGFRKALKDGQKFEHFVKMTTDRIAQFIDFIKELKNVLKNLFGGDDEQRANAFEKLAEWADKLKQKIKSISFKPIAKIIEKVQGFLKDKGISFEWLDNLRSKMENMSIGGVLDKIKERFNNLTANLGIDDFHPIQTIVGWIEQFTGLDIPDFETIKANVGAKITEIVGWFKYDEETGTIPIVDKVKEWIENFKTITFTAWNTLVLNVKNKISSIKTWFMGNQFTGEPGVVGRIKAWLENFKTITFTAWNTLVLNVKNKISSIKTWFMGNQFTGEPGVVGRIKAWIENFKTITFTAWNTLVENVKNKITSIRNWFLGNQFTGEPGVVGRIKAWIEKITGIEVPSFETISSGIINAISDIKDAFLGDDITGEPEVIKNIKAWFTDITGIEVPTFDELIENIKGALSNIKTAFLGDDITGEPGIFGKLTGWFNAITGFDISSFSFEGLISDIQTKFEEIKSLFSGDDIDSDKPGILSKIEGAFKSIKDWFETTFKVDDISEIIPGYDVFKKIITKIQGILAWLTTGDTSGLGDDEPEKVANGSFDAGVVGEYKHARLALPSMRSDRVKLPNEEGYTAILSQAEELKGPLEIIKEAFEELQKWFEKFDIKAAYDTFKEKVIDVVDSVKEWFNGIATKFQGTSIGAKLTAKFDAVKNAFLNFDFSEAYKNFHDKFMAKVNTIRGWFADIKEKFNFHPIEDVQASIETIQKWWEDLNINNGQGESPITQFFGTIKTKLEEFGGSPLVQRALYLFEKLPGILTLLVTGYAIKQFKTFLTKIVEAVDSFAGNNAEAWDKKANSILKVATSIGIISLAIGYLANALSTVNDIAQEDDTQVDKATEIIGKLSGLLAVMSAFSGDLVTFQGKTGEITKGNTTKNITSGALFKIGSALDVAGGFGMMEIAKAIEMVAGAYGEIVDVVKDPTLNPEDLEKAKDIITGLGMTLAGMGAFQSAMIDIGIGPVRGMFSTTFGVSQGVGDLLIVGAIKGLWGVVVAIRDLQKEGPLTNGEIDSAIDVVKKLGDLLTEMVKWSHIEGGLGIIGKKGGFGGFFEFGATASTGAGAWLYVEAVKGLVECVKELNAITDGEVQSAQDRLGGIMAMFDLALFGTQAGDTALDALGLLATKKILGEDPAKLIRSTTKWYKNGLFGDIGTGSKYIMFAEAISTIIDSLDKLSNIEVKDIGDQIAALIGPFAIATTAGAITTMIGIGKGLSSIGAGLILVGGAGIIQGFADLTGHITSFLQFLIDNGAKVEEVLPFVEQITHDITEGIVTGLFSEESKAAIGETAGEIGKYIGVAIGDNILTALLKTVGFGAIDVAGALLDTVTSALIATGLISEDYGLAIKESFSATHDALATAIEYGFNSDEYKEALAKLEEAKDARDRTYRELQDPGAYDPTNKEVQLKSRLNQGALVYELDLSKLEYTIYLPDGSTVTCSEKEFASELRHQMQMIALRTEKMPAVYDFSDSTVGYGANSPHYEINDDLVISNGTYHENPLLHFVATIFGQEDAEWDKAIEQVRPADINEKLDEVIARIVQDSQEKIDHRQYAVDINAAPKFNLDTEEGKQAYDDFIDELYRNKPTGNEGKLVTEVVIQTEVVNEVGEKVLEEKPYVITVEPDFTVNSTYDVYGQLSSYMNEGYTDYKVEFKKYGQDLANDIVEGEVSGLEDGKTETEAAGADTLGTAPIEAAAEAADSHSPSRKTMQLGKDMVDGLVIGLQNSSQLPVFVMAALIGNVIYTVQGKQIYFYQAALDCVQGLTNGFQAGASSAIEAAKTMALDTLNAAKQTLGVASPSKEFAKIGMYSDQGLAQGFIKYIPDVVHAVNETGQTAIDTLYNAMVSPVNDLYDDFDLYPNITPIVDLHNIQNANQLLSRSFGITTSDLMEESRALKSQFDNSLYYEAYDDSGVIGAIMGLNDRLNQLDSSISNMSMVLDSGALVGQLTPRVDKQLGTIARRKARGV